MTTQPNPPAPSAPDARKANPFDATALLGAITSESLKRVETREVASDGKWQYVLMCRRGHVAIFFTSDPRGKLLEPKDWFSTFKKQDEPWRGSVPCQVCSDFSENPEAIEFPIQAQYVAAPRNTVRFFADPKWIFRFAKDETARATPDGALHRATRLPGVLANAKLHASVKAEGV